MPKKNRSAVVNRSNSTLINSFDCDKPFKASKYRWVGKGEPQRDGTVVYRAVEVTVAGRKSLIRCGDSALLSSNNGEELEDEVMQLTAEISNFKTPGEEFLSEQEDNLVYGSHTDEGFHSIGALDPFVAVIVKMWEVPRVNKLKGVRKSIVIGDDVYDDERKARMKIRAQWYFKKEDIATMKGWFQGKSKKALLSSMGPRDLVLSEHSDDNEVFTILGRCRVARRQPLEKSNDKGSLAIDADIPPGAYICRHNVRIPKKGEPGFGYVVVEPYNGEPFDDDVSEELRKDIIRAASNPKEKIVVKVPTYGALNSLIHQGKRKRTEENSLDSSQENKADTRLESDNNASAGSLPRETHIRNSGQMLEKNSTNSTKLDCEVTSQNPPKAPSNSSSNQSASSSVSDQISSSSSSSSSLSDIEEDDDGGSFLKIDASESFLPGTPKKQSGVIHVGKNHQAVVPLLSSLQDPSAYTGRLTADLCWAPGKISNEALRKYFSDSCTVLKGFVESHNGEYTFEPDAVCMPPCSILEPEGPLPRGAKWLTKDLARECKADAIYDLLHALDYQCSVALGAIKEAPEKCLVLWNTSERQKFELGFQQRCGNLRSIAKLIPGKSMKDVVDYHYRFKIPEQFRKYEQQKISQARRMMASADMKILDTAAAGGKPGVYGKKTRNWTNSGVAEQRRIVAKEFLVQTRDSLGADTYLILANNLKMFHRKEIGIIQLKDNIINILAGWPDLIERFNDFLPHSLRAAVN